MSKLATLQREVQSLQKRVAEPPVPQGDSPTPIIYMPDNTGTLAPGEIRQHGLVVIYGAAREDGNEQA